MLLEEYHKALRQGLKEVKAAAAAGRETGLLVLPESMEAKAVRRESLGVVEIPMELIDGTYNGMRRDDFSPGFFPVLSEDSEFASKWEMLCKAHLAEGIRDPIKAVEYLNHFYVIEGHKRVSVLKHFGASSVPGTVTRLYPPHSDDPEVEAYYEFLNFYQLTGQNFLEVCATSAPPPCSWPPTRSRASRPGCRWPSWCISKSSATRPPMGR